MPTCIAIMNNDIVDDDRPTPPCAGLKRRYAGTHEFSPHQANRHAEFISAIAVVTAATFGLNSELKRPRSATSALRHIFGSSRFRRIHSVKSAGSTPTKNTPRQPQSGMTMRLTSAARP